MVQFCREHRDMCHNMKRKTITNINLIHLFMFIFYNCWAGKPDSDNLCLCCFLFFFFLLVHFTLFLLFLRNCKGGFSPGSSSSFCPFFVQTNNSQQFHNQFYIFISFDMNVWDKETFFGTPNNLHILKINISNIT